MGRRLRITSCVHALLALFVFQEADAEEVGVKADKPQLVAEIVCPLIERHARNGGLSPDFLARLIWQESRFDPNALSPVGAQGIAQFMPYTAKERGLRDPYDIKQAIPHSVGYLSDLHGEFGHWALAAAAYNAGPARVRAWLDGRSGLPRETEGYIQIITGLPAKAFAGGEKLPDLTLNAKLPFLDACRDMARHARRSAKKAVAAVWKPWGVQVAGHMNRSTAMKAYQRYKAKYGKIIGSGQPMVVQDRRARGLRAVHAVRVGADSRGAADKMCARLRSVGGACVVMKN